MIQESKMALPFAVESVMIYLTRVAQSPSTKFVYRRGIRCQQKLLKYSPAQCRAGRALLEITQTQLATIRRFGLSTVVDFEKDGGRLTESIEAIRARSRTRWRRIHRRERRRAGCATAQSSAAKTIQIKSDRSKSPSKAGESALATNWEAGVTVGFVTANSCTQLATSIRPRSSGTISNDSCISDLGLPMSFHVKKHHPALKHAGYSATGILPGENPAEFEKLHRELIAEFNPNGALENDIVATMARLVWRKRNLETFRIAERARARCAQIMNVKRSPKIR